MKNCLNNDTLDQSQGIFNREIVKKEQSEVLEKIIPALMSQANAARIAEIDASSIKRARDGQTLLNATAMATIIKEAYRLRSFYDLNTFLPNLPNLLNYLKMELNGKMSSPKYESTDTSYQCYFGIKSNVCLKIYCILYAKKTIKLSLLYDLYGKEDVEKSIVNMEAYGIVNIHRELDILSMHKFHSSSKVNFQTKIMKMIIEDFDIQTLHNSCYVYSWDGVMTTDEDSAKLQKFLLNTSQNLAELIKEMESKPIELRNTLTRFVIATPNPDKLST